jgi:hypothetical protein
MLDFLFYILRAAPFSPRRSLLVRHSLLATAEANDGLSRCSPLAAVHRNGQDEDGYTKKTTKETATEKQNYHRGSFGNNIKFYFSISSIFQKGTEDEKEFNANTARVRLVGRGGLHWLQEKRSNGESRQSG